MEHSKQQSANAEAPLAPATNNHTGLKIGLVITSVLALAGLGFGIYGLTKSRTTAVSDLKIEVKNNDGSTTTLETDKIEVKDDTQTIVISDAPINSLSFKADNFIDTNITYDLSYSGSNETYEVVHSYTLKSPADHDEYNRYTLDANGKVTAEYIPTYTSGKQRKTVDISSKFAGRVQDIAIGQTGQGGTVWLIAILEDGTVGVLKEPWEGEDFGNATIIEGAKDIARIYGNIVDISLLGYAQDKTGKIHRIVHSDVANDPEQFKLAD